MTRSQILSIGLVLGLVAGVAAQTTAPQTAKPAPAARPVNHDAAALAQFVKQAEAYVAFHKKLATGLDVKLTETSSQAEIAAHEKALGEAIRKMRAGSKPGEIFNERAARVFKRLISADYRKRTGQKKRLVEDEVPEFHPVINQTYPSTAALATFPATLLAVLPKLPEPLEYRLVSNHLILRDIEANIIVDYVHVIP